MELVGMILILGGLFSLVTIPLAFMVDYYIKSLKDEGKDKE